MFGDSLWALVVIGGFVILAAALLYGRISNKAAGVDEARGEAATRRNYAEQAVEDDARTP